MYAGIHPFMRTLNFVSHCIQWYKSNNRFPNFTLRQSSVICWGSACTYESVIATCVGMHVGVSYAPLHPFAHDV